MYIEGEEDANQPSLLVAIAFQAGNILTRGYESQAASCKLQAARCT